MVRLLLIACACAAAIIIAENTVGNAGFPLCFWYFDMTPAWQWSLPVHGSGFIWAAAWTFALRRRPAVLSMIISWIFFIASEIINRFWLMLFDYSQEPFGVNFSFVAVLFLYAVLCVLVVYTLRRWVFPSRSDRS